MAYRTLDLTLISAKDLKHVNLISKMEVYADVTLSFDPARSKQRTVTDRDGGTNPIWKSTLRFPIPVNAGTDGTLHVMLHTERALGDRAVGEVNIPLKEILASASGDGPSQIRYVSYQVKKPCSGKLRGTINLSYKLSELITGPVAKPGAATAPPAGYPPTTNASYPPTAPYPPPPPAGYPTSAAEKPPKITEPVTAYPAASSSATGAYPPPPPQYNAPPTPPYGYAPPPQYGYGQPPPQFGYPPQYGYPPATQPQVVKPKKNKKNNNFGLGIGAGLLGGLILGDIVSDAADDVYDAGYDAGFDDAGGFDF